VAKVVFDQVGKQYGNGVPVVRDLSLTIQDQELLVLVGPSGCGKSTALRMIAGLEGISRGSLFIDEDRVNDVPPKDRDVAMVFQSYALYPHMTCFENMAFALQLRRMAKTEIRARVLAAAKTLAIEHLLERRPKELSGGQRQRVAIGRAIVREPRVFLMDEPLSNLDAKLRVQMRSEIKRFHQDLNATVIYVTHDQLEAVTMADKMAVMNGGLLQQYDSPRNVFDHPVNVFVAGFVGSPAMSLIALEVASNGADVCLHSPDGWNLPLSPANARKAQNSTSKRVVLGARHSTLRIHKSAVPGAVEGKVYTVEPTGDITFAQIYLGSAVVIVSLDPNFEIRPDEPVWVAFDQDRMHLFDGETQQALAAA
jgi:multiple sugar transport system ATP-binding protein